MNCTKPDDRLRSGWMMGLCRHAGGPMAMAVAMPLLSGLVLVGQAYVLSRVLHDAVVGQVDRQALLPMIPAIALMFVMRIVIGMFGEQAGALAAERMKLAVRQRLFARMLNEQPAWTAARSSGALTSALIDHVEGLDGFIARFFPAMIHAAVLPIVFAAAVLPVDWVVALLFLVTAPLIPLFMALVGYGAEAATRDHAQALSRLSGLFADRLRGILTLKLFGRTEAEIRVVRDSSEGLRRRTLGILRIAFLSSAVLEFFAALGVAGVALYVGLTLLGMVDLRSGPLTLQAGLFCLLMAPEVYQPLRQLAAHYHDRAAAKAAVAEIARQFDQLPDMKSIPQPRTGHAAADLVPHRAPASVQVTGLTLHRLDRSAVILDEVTWHVPAGMHVALLGESGIGKTSFLEVLARLRDVQGGILLDGVPLDGIDECILRSEVAMLGQRPRLFDGTIASNIRLGNPGASDGDIRTAARLAEVTAFADDLDQPVGDGGSGLSGGEAHRVALARIFLRRPRLLLLDEPTAHLDPATEARVLHHLRIFAKGRTMIVATHSEAVAAAMDRSYRLVGKKILPTPQPRQLRTHGWTEHAA